LPCARTKRKTGFIKSLQYTPLGLFSYLLNTLKAISRPFIISLGKNISGFVENSKFIKVYITLIRDVLKHLLKGENKVIEVINNKVWGLKGYFFSTGFKIS